MFPTLADPFVLWSSFAPWWKKCRSVAASMLSASSGEITEVRMHPEDTEVFANRRL